MSVEDDDEEDGMTSKRVRDEAIELLLCAADRLTTNPHNLLDWSNQGSSKAARDLAYQAYLCSQIAPFEFLEAAGLLLDGWNPGDPVVRLQHGAKP